jgi:hypothetical protein
MSIDEIARVVINKEIEDREQSNIPVAGTLEARTKLLIGDLGGDCGRGSSGGGGLGGLALSLRRGLEMEMKNIFAWNQMANDTWL